MSLLLIVLLLDESHLELVEDVLKETNFNDKDWEELGQALGVHCASGQEHIYRGKLKECLRLWLTSSDTTTCSYRLQFQCYDSPTLGDLAAALDSIGYSKAAEYITKTCKLIIIINDQCY